MVSILRTLILGEVPLQIVQTEMLPIFDLETSPMFGHAGGTGGSDAV